MGVVKYSIVVDESHLSQTQSIAETASRNGFKVESVIPEIGAIFGQAEEKAIDQLRAIDGIEDVMKSGSVQLPDLDPSLPQ
jgi:hypothetical protein